MNIRWISLSMMLATAGLGLVACEVKNPIDKNKAVAQSPADGAGTVAAQQQQLEGDKPQAVPGAGKAPQFKKIDTSKLRMPQGQKQLQINDKVRKALQERAKEAEAARQGQAGKEAGDKGTAPKRELTSAAFTKIKPDGEDTAKKATVAADLKRYTADLEGKGKLMATIHTTMGDLHCELFEKRAPLTVANFVGLARGLKAWQDPATREAMVGIPLYQDVLFHRVIPKFMIQGGDPLGRGTGNPGYRIQDEFHPELKHDKPGLLSMANSGPNTGGSQFFVTEVPTPHLDNRHAIFGRCEEVELIKKISGVPRGAMDRPKEPVMIKKIVISRGK